MVKENMAMVAFLTIHDTGQKLLKILEIITVMVLLLRWCSKLLAYMKASWFNFINYICVRTALSAFPGNRLTVRDIDARSEDQRPSQPGCQSGLLAKCNEGNQRDPDQFGEVERHNDAEFSLAHCLS